MRFRPFFKDLPVVAAAVICLGLWTGVISCSDAAQLDATPQSAAPFAALLPPVPPSLPPAGLPPLRSLSAAQQINGDVFFLKSGAAATLGTSMELPSDFGTFEWAIYHNVGDGSPLTSLEVDFTMNNGTDCWIGVANYDSLTWDVKGPFTTSPATIDLSAGNHQSPGNDAYFVVVAFDSAFVVVNSSTLTYTSADTTYTADIKPLLDTECIACHQGPGAGSAGIRLDTYAFASANANDANAAIIDESMPPIGGPLTAEEKTLFQAWIDAGTPE